MESKSRERACVHALGLSNRPPEALLDLLRAHGITALADVRSRPYSKFATWFNKAELETLVRGAGLAYVYLGRELGGMPGDPALLDASGGPDYARIASSPGFSRGLDRVLDGLAKGWVICLTCAEADPSRCHRQHLLAPALAARGVEVVHILKDGSRLGWRELRERERLGRMKQGRLPP